MRKITTRFFLAALLAAVLLTAGAVVPGTGVEAFAATATLTDAAASASTGVERSEVCMVTNRVLGRPQIAVEFEGKTYYGCCGVCASRIKNDRRVRYAIDPVSGAEVDKARAYIVEGPGGAALYFESADTADEFARVHPGS